MVRSINLHRVRILIIASIMAIVGSLALVASNSSPAIGQASHYEQESSSSRAMGTGEFPSPGVAVREVGNPGRLVVYIVQGVDSQNRTFGLLQWPASGNYVAATNDCDAATTKDISSSFGTVVTWDDAGSGTHRWLFRACNYKALSGPGSVGSQFKIRAQGASGWFQRFVRVNP